MRIRASDLVDVFAYLVVLGVFIQVFPAVISETFLLALLTAILLKLVLEVVVLVKTRTIKRLKTSRIPAVRLANAVVLLLVMPGSKFLVLELVALTFGDAVHLGGFFHVTVLIIALMLARGAVRRFLPREPAAG